MKKDFVNVILTCVAILLLFAINGLAQSPTTMVYQGRLADADGNPMVDSVDVNFAIYLAIDANPADSIWSETFPVIPDDQGVFTAELGTIIPLTTAIFNGDPRFLGIKVGDDNQMTPFQLLASAPYAINSNIADGSVTNTKIANGSVTSTKIADGSVTSTKITNGTILNTDISNSAAIWASKINGTAATLSANQRFAGYNYFGDSTMIVNNYGIRIGDNSVPSTTTYSLVRIERNFNIDTEYRYGLDSRLNTTGNGGLVGVYGYVASTGSSPGVMYGVYGGASGGSTNYAGYFAGNVTVTGTLSKGAGSFKIDHPLDPANKYLYHSFVESPDMMNVYNGNITTDAGGIAVVKLPDYFNALNKDFRYQLTVIGDFAQAIVAEEISGNQFTIRTDKPSIKVSWQVTGIRKDAFAEANRIQVEVEKPANEKGLYLHPKAFKLGPEMQINYQMNLEAQKNSGGNHD